MSAQKLVSTHNSWQTFPFWTICRPKSVTGHHETAGLLSVYLDRGVIPYSEGGGLVHKPSESLEKYQLVESGDLVMNNQQAWRGSVGISRHKGIVSPAYLVFSLDKKRILPGFASYLFRDKQYIDKYMLSSLSVGDIQRQLKWHHLRRISLNLPDIPTQSYLSNLLDCETARIDTLIAKKTRFIELLKEKRQAVITKAVTKGLDDSVEMKDSGVDWLGAVPTHWDVTALKRIVSTPITDGPHETPVFHDDGVPFVSAEAVSSGRIDFERIRGFISREDHERFSRKYLPQKNDIYMVKSGATTGVTAIVEDDREFNIWSPIAVIRCSGKAHPPYVLLFMRSKNFLDAVALNWSYGTQQNIGMGVLGNLSIALPSYKEQMVIADSVNRTIGRLNELVRKTERSIELLKEKRSALITAAVTGKIDVREAA